MSACATSDDAHGGDLVMRREFVAGAAGAGAALALFPPGLEGVEREKGPGGLERRALGRTGEKLSIVGFGGIVVGGATPDEASRRVGEAIAAGVNYFDVAPSYGDAEAKLGPALEPYRKGVFLACKTQGRTREAATAELEASLRALRTDHFDLYQHHAVTTRRDVETILGPGGAMEAFEAARKAGKVRFLGFSAHSVEAALALMEGYAFDTLLFPFNYATWHAGAFGPQVLARAREKGMGILCLKAMAKGPWPEGATKRYAKCWYEPLDAPEEAALGLRFTLSHPVTAAIPPGDETLFRLALRLAAGFEPLTPAEVEAVRGKGLAAAPLFRFPSAEA
jgi:aryl-alcohol dehydrogenase-like predicted oxidoreductase